MQRENPLTCRGMREDKTRWRIGLPGRVRALVTQMAVRGLSANEIACALISMMARSSKAPIKGRIDARPHSPPDRRSPLDRTAGPYIWVISGQSVLLGLCPLCARMCCKTLFETTGEP